MSASEMMMCISWPQQKSYSKIPTEYSRDKIVAQIFVF